VIYRGGEPTLVHTVVPGGGHLSLTAVRYEYQGRAHAEIVEHLEAPAQRGLAAAGGGAGIPLAGEGRALSLQTSQRCVGRHEDIVAYGVLRGTGDLVSEREGDEAKGFKELIIPRAIYPDRTLVYGLLKPGSVHIQVRTKAGAFVGNEQLTLRPLGTPCDRQAIPQG
jgi:hypothetical protein